MPTQWRTIAPIVGRTATQCLERYQLLLDEAEKQENEDLGLTGPGDEAGPSDDVRKLKPGELDTEPESRPAKPDPIDMDEDEKEMLSEARARLANTQGKKAKRKARERQLEEARRLAVLQKRRELKAAGIISKIREKKKGLDYSADIPFEKQPQIGFYDVGEEQAKTYENPVGKTRTEAEGKRKASSNVEDERKKKQKTANADANNKFQAAREAQIARLREADQISNRRKLDLPMPQVSESELENIVKLGQAGENARELVEEEGDKSTQGLIGDYNTLNSVKNLRTPRTEQGEDNVMNEAKNLRNMISSQTPLLGEENTPLHGDSRYEGTGYESATPRHAKNFTPNPLATPRDLPTGTPLRTPIRDSLSINRTDGVSEAFETPAERRYNERSERNRLKLGFKNLPKPQNNFEIELPDDNEITNDDNQLGKANEEFKEDAAVRDAKIKAQLEEEERKILARRSMPIQLSLPRPVNVDTAKLLNQLTLNEKSPEDMINNEFIKLIVHDSIHHPLPGSVEQNSKNDVLTELSDDYVDNAKQLLHSELASQIGVPGANPQAVKRGLLASIENELNEILLKTESAVDYIYSPQSNSMINVNDLNDDQKVNYYNKRFNNIKDKLTNEAMKSVKQEKKLGIKLGGYIARNNTLSKKLIDSFHDIQLSEIDREAFGVLALNEREYTPLRIYKSEKEVDELRRRESELQTRYKELSDECRKKLEVIEGLEEDEAERLNEIAMSN